MFRIRVFPVAAVLALGLSLSACSGMTSNFDPTDWITGEFFDTRQKLPGERKPVFPQGVPGVSDGVPKEMVRGNQQQQAAIEPETPPPAQAAKPAPKPRVASPAPKPRTASAPPARPAPAAPAQPSGQPTGAWPDPNTAQQQPRARTAPPPADAQANWPPPDASTFSR